MRAFPGRSRPLFVRYLVLAAASTLTVAALAAAGFASGVNGAPLAVTVVIVAAGAVVSGYAGVLGWTYGEIEKAFQNAVDSVEWNS